ncbi:SET domain-containing protein-lysine N-methyltransferase [Aquabacterium sp. A7-Y]|uniref:SET domain-containing protein-lysine N-methyltransferase n=1 Tax=Aquabacterium sp. A7-Y TaxID=1349605 RepID=UPI00223CA0D1|nr:SET domain-containing protein-lysine N-methyltransferase [Aquabacterium sp. A7-Y]MCW7538712.1 SET domain-containing protein-lysine N-methyltransferase [Aquabacterium sp. A7-Y]
MSTLSIVESTAPPEGFYPYADLDPREGYPSTSDFQVIQTQDGRGAGIRAVRGFKRAEMMARVSGQLLSSRRLHTLQINPQSHLFDPYFCGLLLHSCDPNTRLDMVAFELWALRDISAGEVLTMDYATTEDVLMRQFACRCGAPSCRRWIAGAKERPNEEGLAMLSRSQAVAEH